ncbi:hypothetical protein P3X46_018999 [Hevea brasiliensis]|uniref:Phytocyanin domain-containing protein n=1 Tax=Hevea brasiliensis TaxID=3981 RepID=A0ABQ9LSF6_HEVBR|nr:early nodulin-like protein 4 [Hevea brasiliensis]KAJ9170939.1 hypothetical protein P3X46_018999 [Hevea brasiliensis]
MGSQRFPGFLLVMFLMMVMMGFLLGSSQAYQFHVGGRDGWVLNPSENYTLWAPRNRFQVNDTLFFKYKKGSNSVLVVIKDDYYSCNIKKPIQSLTDGDSIFKFDRSGPFYFISGKADNCNNGQRLITVVMAVRPKPQLTPVPAPQSPSPVAAASPTSSPPYLPETPAESTTDNPTDPSAPAPAPAPANSGSGCFTGLVGLVLGASIGFSSLMLG